MSSTSSEPAGRFFGLVDCNNFYASCERLFRPDLAGKPVVVLSNNDGCIVARSPEAKALGIPMGEPEFRARALLRRHKVAVFSSNYALYGDLSRRVMTTLESLCPQVEPYSIDEAFLRLDGALAVNALELGLAIRERVQQWTGIAVSVGLAPTRTLAKLLNLRAKQGQGVALLGFDAAEREALLRETPVEAIWGIGRQQAARCHARGLDTAYQLQAADDGWLRKHLTVTGLQTALELRGRPCIGLGNAPVPRKTLISSRSFGHKITDKAQLAEALAAFTARAAERLRREGLVTSAVGVHIRTARCDEVFPHDETVLVPLPRPGSDTRTLMNAARLGLDRLYKVGPAYAKAGIMLCELARADAVQGSLLHLDGAAADAASLRLGAVLDAVNARFGRQTLHFGAEGLGAAPWHMRQEHRSPRLTTRWDELPTVS